MTIRRFGFSALAVLVLGMIPAMAFAEELKDPFEGMYNPKKLLRGAKLTDTQVTQILELRRPTRAQERDIEKQIETLNQEFADAFTGESPIDEAAFTARAEKLGQLSQQLDRMKVKNMLKIRALLTPEQLHGVAKAHQMLKDLNAQRKAIEPTVAAEEGKSDAN